MNLDKRLTRLVKSHRRLLIFAVLFGLTTAVCIIGQAAVLSKIFNRIFLVHDTLPKMYLLIIWFGIFSIARAVFQWSERFTANKIASNIKLSLRTDLMAHLFKLGPSFTKSQSTGDLSTTFLKGIDNIEAYFSQYLPQIFLSALIPITILFFVFRLDLLSGFVFLLTAPLIPVFMILIGNQSLALTKKQWKTLSRLSSHFLDVVQGLTTLKIFNRSQEQIKIIAKMSDDYRLRTMKVLKIAFLSALSLEMLATISTAVIAVEVGLRLLYAKMTFENAIFILILAPEFYLPLRLLGTHFHAGVEGVSASGKIFEILDASVVSPHKSAQSFNLREDKIMFRDTSFRYPSEGKNALSGINLEILPFQSTALVGPSGSGKTTLINLLAGFLRATEGEIQVGGKNLENLDTETWRQQLAWVAQNPYLFHTTIEQNLRLAKPEASENELLDAMKFAGMDDWIDTLPQGLQTHVGEKGARLSGGEAQRLAIARAYLKQAPLVIFDEPAANIDPENEKLIQTAIEDLMKICTVITIAHRLSMIKNFDQILLLTDGKIIESGSHDELLLQNGAYANLIKTYGAGI